MARPTDLLDLGHGRGLLRRDAALSVFRLDASVGRPVDSNSAYRDYDEQMIAYTTWETFKKNPAAWRRANPGKKDPPRAIHPDLSWHCRGDALDTDDAPGYGRGPSRSQWRDHGWTFTVADELWHGQYYRSLDKYLGQAAGGGGGNIVPQPPTVPGQGEEEMTPQQQQELNDKLDLLIGYLFAGGPSVESGAGAKHSIFGRLINVDRQVTSADGTFKTTSTNARLIRLEEKVDELIEKLGPEK